MRYRTLSVMLLAALGCQAQSDPGPRPGPPLGGLPIRTLSRAEMQYFTFALKRFGEVNSVSGTLEPGTGLGSAFNGNSCQMCHSEPAIGGSSPGLRSRQHSAPNPQVGLASLHEARNVVPSFITPDGPVRVARFIRSTTDSNSLDGGVHDLFTIQGRSDAAGCIAAQPDFATQLAHANVIFRIPIPLFGEGLVESTPDAALQATLALNPALKVSLGIAGRFNLSGNDGSISCY